MLDGFGLRPRHRFGQNFLHDAGKMEQIVAAAELAAGDVVLEVGPGTGALSIRLLHAGAALIAVEIDRDLEPILREQFKLAGSEVELIIDDVLAGKHAINPRVLAALSAACERQWSRSSTDALRSTLPQPFPAREGSRPFKLIANLPYHVASPLIANLLLLPFAPVPRESEPLMSRSGNSAARSNALPYGRGSDDADPPEPGADHLPSAIRNPHFAIPAPRLSLAVITIQREVADRLAAPPGGKDYGPLGILVQSLCEVERITTLPPGCFWPQPEVESAVVRLRVREKPLTDEPHRLTALLHTLFSRRRKQLGAILGRDIAFPAGIDPKQRPETLSVEQLIALSRLNLERNV